MRLALLLTCALLAAPALAQTADGLLPLDGRWVYPHYLTWRPGDGQVSDVDPPRFSWPYLPGVIPGEGKLPAMSFRFQIAPTPDFAEPVVDVTTPYNFYNALAPLGPPPGGAWYWRVQHQPAEGEPVWSEPRGFTLAPDAVAWDRRPILAAAERLAAMPHPRLAPEGGDWIAWRARLEADPRTRSWVEQVLERAEKIAAAPWFGDFYTTDAAGESPIDERRWAAVANELVTAVLAWRLTGDARYAPAKDHLLTIAGFAKGGLTSPEYHAKVRKWPTQITEYLALGYDWLHPDLTPAEREKLVNAVDWRLEATYLQRASWRQGDAAHPSGVAMFAQSHPYENFMWSLPGVLLTAGDSDTATELVPLVLNYLTGVTSAHGPDEGWNEGLSYGTWKGLSMLQAAMYAELLLPDLDLGRSPYFARLGQWYAHLYPLGIQRLAFGDYARSPEGTRGGQRNVARFIAWLSGAGAVRTRYDALVGELGDQATARTWLELFASQRMDLPAPAPEAKRALFAEAGWVMVNSDTPSDRAGYADSVGMIFKCRPRGGFSHSYRSENDFVWHAYGQALSAGAGNTAYPDPHARHSMSHNVVLVNGVGQEWDPKQPAHPYVGRLLAYREGERYVWFAGDATHAYQTVPGLRRWIRHVVFVDDTWFAIFDDLAMAPDADPARFSWLFHVAPTVPLELDPAAGRFRYTLEDVVAEVALAGDSSRLDMLDLQARDSFRNPITGEDMHEETTKRLGGAGRELPEETFMAHSVWVTNREPVREWTFLATLLAHREGEPAPRAVFEGERAVTVALPGGEPATVSFDPAVAGDVVIDVAAARRHAGAE